MTWVPHPGPQTEFCSRGEFEVLFGGSAGPGKTDCLIWDAARFHEIPRYRALILRRTFPQLQEILDRCHEYYRQYGAIWKAGDKRFYFPSGAFVQLGHMQHETNKYDYQGKQFHYFGWDELTQFLFTQYAYLTFSRARTVDPEIPTRVRATSNPGGIGHRWVKERFIDPAPPRHVVVDDYSGMSRVFIPALVTDNPTLMDADPGYVRRLAMLPEIDRRRLLEGDWEVFEGQVFSDLIPEFHMCEPFELPPEWEYFGAFDWGYSKPFSYAVYAVDYDDILYRVMEWYGCKDGESDKGLRMVAADVADEILKREAKLGVKIQYRVADKSLWNNLPGFRQKEAVGKDLNEDFEARGVFCERANVDRIQGWQQVHTRLQVDREYDEETGEITAEHSKFYAFSDQHHFWRLMPEMQADAVKDEDIDTKQEDHIADEFRYACMWRPIQPKRKAQVPAGSFQSTRSKHMKAKKLANRMGITVSQAYARIR